MMGVYKMINNFEKIAAHVEEYGFNITGDIGSSTPISQYYLLDMEIEGDILDATLYVDYEHKHIIVNELFNLIKERSFLQRGKEIFEDDAKVKFLNKLYESISS